MRYAAFTHYGSDTFGSPMPQELIGFGGYEAADTHQFVDSAGIVYNVNFGVE
jgi:hypothetical protein